ncbi:MAG: SLOG family protein [Clostridia bacterium]|nr:SLOG family protein [Clostridia bacterium]
MSGLVCAFTGHREIPEEDFERVRDFTKKTVDLLVARGVNRFITGGAAGYDMLAAEIVIEAKKYASVKLVVAVPCKGQDRYYKKCDRERYRRIIDMADEVEILSGHYFDGCMHIRNRYMVDNSDFLVSYCTRDSGGSYYTRDYARKKGKYVIECGIDKFD